MAPIIGDWVSDLEDESKPNDPQSAHIFVQTTKLVKLSGHYAQPVEAFILDDTPNLTSSKTNGRSKRKNRKTCFVCRGVDHLIKDCNFHAKPKTQPTPRNSAHRGDDKQYASSTKKYPQKHIVPAAVLTKSKPVSVTAARPAQVVSAAKGKKGKWRNPQYALKDKGVIDNASQSLDMLESEDIVYSDYKNVGVEADFNKLETSITVSPILTTRIHNAHPISQIIGNLSSTTQTRSMARITRDQGGISQILNEDFHTCMFACFLLQEEPKRMSSMRELTLFLGLQVKQKEDGIFINQDKYVNEILKKFGLTKGKSASTPIDTKKPLLKDPDGEDVDVHIYRSMIGPLMYLTSSRTDIMFASMSAKRTSWNEFNSTMASAMNYLSTGDLSTHSTKYISPTLTQKVFANMRSVGKGCLGVETPLFKGMLVAREPENQGDAEEQSNDDNAAEEPVTAIDDVEDQTIQSPTPLTPPPQPQNIPSTSQVQSPPPKQQSPPPAQPQGADFPMSLLQEALDACAALARRVEHLEHDKVAQDLEIIKLKSRVKKLERTNKVKTMKLRRLRKVGTSQRIESSDDTIMEDVSNQGRMIDESDKDEGAELMNEKEEKETKEVKVNPDDAQVEGRQADIYHIDMDHATKVLTNVPAAPVNAAAVVTTAAPVKVGVPSTRRRRGVVIRDPEEKSSAKTPTKTKSKDKGKGIMVEEPKPMKKKQQVELDEAYARKLQEELNQDIN
nr:hypothetical protein [Tanacetum cinerariifolium]